MPSSTRQMTRCPGPLDRAGFARPGVGCPDGPMSRSSRRGEILEYYRSLLARFGPQNWWPAQSRFEVVVGAYLTQNTNWSNVEKAIAALRRAQVLSVKGVREAPLRRLEQLVRSSGYFRQKAQRLKNFVAFL